MARLAKSADGRPVPVFMVPQENQDLDQKDVEAVWSRDAALYIVIVAPEKVAWGDARC